MEPPKKPMLKEAAEAGFYNSALINENFPKIQIVTVEQVLRGDKIQYPRLMEVTFKKAPKAKGAAAQGIPLPLQGEAEPAEEEEN
jgi:hypothetical protein